MKKISIMYPSGADAWFDVSYYLEIHMPMSIRLLGDHPGYRGVAVEPGIAGATPGSAPTYVVMCHFLFASVEDFMAAFTPHAALLQGDMPNYTNIVPLIQFSEALIAGKFRRSEPDPMPASLTGAQE